MKEDIEKFDEKEFVAEFEIKDLLPIGFTLIVLGITLAYGLNVMSDVKDDIGTSNCAARSDTYTSYNTSSDLCYNSSGSTAAVNTAEFNASSDGITGVSKLPEKMPLIATVVVAAIIIGILVRYLWVRFT